MAWWRRVTTTAALFVTMMRASLLLSPAIIVDDPTCVSVTARTASKEGSEVRGEELVSMLQVHHARPRAGGKAKGSKGKGRRKEKKRGEGGNNEVRRGVAGEGSSYEEVLRPGQASPSKVTFWTFVTAIICSVFIMFGHFFMGWVIGAERHEAPSGGEDQEEGDDFDLDEDIYSASIYSIIHDGKQLFGDRDSGHISHRARMFRFAFIFTLLVANLIGQMCLLVWTYVFVVAPSVNKVQRLYRRFNQDCYSTDGVFNATRFHDFEEKDELCDIVFSKFNFMLVCLALWSATMLWEHRKNDDLLWRLRIMRHTDNFSSMVERGGDNVERVKALTRPIRWLLFWMVIVPKTAINIVLLIFGTIWLVATESFSSMILNAVALEFIINIDELFFGALVPRTLKANINNFKLWTPKEVDKDNQMMWNYSRSIGYICLVVLIPYCYIEYGQGLPLVGVYPGYVRGQVARHCSEVIKSKMYRICIWGEHCFTYGRS